MLSSFFKSSRHFFYMKVRRGVVSRVLMYLIRKATDEMVSKLLRFWVVDLGEFGADGLYVQLVHHEDSTVDVLHEYAVHHVSITYSNSFSHYPRGKQLKPNLRNS